MVDGLTREEGARLLADRRELAEDELTAIYNVTGGLPYALMKLKAMLASEPRLIVDDILKADPNPDIIRDLVSRSVSVLDDDDERIVQALAVFGMAVPPSAVDYVLRDWMPHIDAASLLPRLVERNVVLGPKDQASGSEASAERESHGEVALYSLDEQVQAYAWAMLPRERALNLQFWSRLPLAKPFSLEALCARAARYLSKVQTRKFSSMRDIYDRRAEFRLRLHARDAKGANRILEQLLGFLTEQSQYLLIRQMAEQVVEHPDASPAVSLSARRRLAWALWKLWQPEDAVYQQKKVIVAERDHDARLVDQFMHARYLRSAGCYSESEGLMSNVLSGIEAGADLGAETSRVYGELAQSKHRTGYLDDAIELYGRAIDLAGTDPATREEHLRKRAAVFLTLGELVKAQTDLAESGHLVAATSSELKAYHEELEARTIFLAGGEGAYRKARELLARARERLSRAGIPTGQERVLTLLGRYELAWENLKAAEECAEDARELSEQRDGGDFTVRLLRGCVLATERRWQDVEDIVLPLLPLRPEQGTMQRRNLIAIAELNQGKTSEAAASFEVAEAEARIWLGRCARNPEVRRLLTIARTGLFLLGKRPRSEVSEALVELRKVARLPGAMALTHWWLRLLKPSFAYPWLFDAIVAEANGVDVTAARAWQRDRATSNRLDEALVQRLLASLPDRPGSAANDFRAYASDRSAEGLEVTDRLSGILQRMLVEATGSKAALIAATLIDFDPTTSDEVRMSLAERYQVPGRLTAASVDVSPAFNADVDYEVEQFGRPEPAGIPAAEVEGFYDLFAAVCRVCIGGEAKGTGVLVAPDLVLTNFHVVGGDGPLMPDGRPEQVSLEFRLVSEGRSTQVVNLHRDDPVVESSPSTELDFVLLRLARPVDSTPARISQTLPARGDPLHLLHHPRGGTLMLGYGFESVRSVKAERGLIHYEAATAGGSSGAPCFNEDLELAAIHRAERALSFRIIREGVLMHSIGTRISGYLEVGHD